MQRRKDILQMQQNLFLQLTFFECSFNMYKKIGGFIQFRPLSFYSSALDKRLTTSTELFSFTFGAFYSLK